MKFNEKLMKLRKEKGMTQEELAFELGVSRQSVSKWELGECEPDISKLKEISKLFQVSIDFLLLDDEERQQDEKGNTTNVTIIKIIPSVLIGIGGFGIIVSIILAFLFPHYNCGLNCASIIGYLFLDWCSDAVLWRFGLFIPSFLCVIIPIVLFLKEKGRKNNEKSSN